jgi:hypothetical protein
VPPADRSASAAEPESGGAIAFAERLLSILDEGSYTATYKYAVLLGLIDLSLEHTTSLGAAPDIVYPAQLARKVVELYWRHTMPYPGLAGPTVLRQNSAGQAEIVSLIRRFRSGHAPDPSTPLFEARASAPQAFGNLLADAEWKLIEMPLPRLQRVGTSNDPFLYRISWDESIRRGETSGPDFDNASSSCRERPRTWCDSLACFAP